MSAHDCVCVFNALIIRGCSIAHKQLGCLYAGIQRDAADSRDESHPTPRFNQKSLVDGFIWADIHRSRAEFRHENESSGHTKA